MRKVFEFIKAFSKTTGALRVAAVMVIAAAVLALPAVVLADGVSVTSSNGDEVRVFENITIKNSHKGNVITVLGDVRIDGDMDGQVVALFGDVTVNARVSGQVVSVFGKTLLTERANIDGNLITLGLIEKAEGALVSGQQVRIFGQRMDFDISSIFYLRLVLTLLFTASIFILGFIILILSGKRQTQETQDIDKRFDIKLILGILTFTGSLIILILLAVTLVIPVLFIILMAIANIYASILLGKLLIGFLTATRNIFLEFFTGLTTITLIKLLVLFLIPQKEAVLSLVLSAAFFAFFSSIGLGVLMESKFARK